jgi:adhesin transport system membrane fusion protein
VPIAIPLPSDRPQVIAAEADSFLQTLADRRGNRDFVERLPAAAAAVPEGDALVIEALVRPADIAFLRLGQKANIKISDYDYSIYRTLPGVVEQIAPDAVTDERSGTSHFTIRLSTPATVLVAADGVRLPIGADMTAKVDILGRKHSVLSYLYGPVTRLRDSEFREEI